VNISQLKLRSEKFDDDDDDDDNNNNNNNNNNQAATIVYRFTLLIRKLKICAAISHFRSKYDNPQQTPQEFRATALILT